MTFRMYVDEVGNHDLKSSEIPNERFLGLTGVIMTKDDARTVLRPAIESLKEECFGSHPDDPIILHRKEISSRKYPFDALRNAEVEERFNARLLSLFETAPYTVITILCDKREMRAQYGDKCWHPYHYGMRALLERYGMFLRSKKTTGDVIAEARGGKEDKDLAKEFRSIVTHGTHQMSAQDFARAGMKPDLILKTKAHNIAGLQFADLLAHPSTKAMVASCTGGPPVVGFAAKIISILESSKYRRSNQGVIDGFGRKRLP